MEHNNNNPTTNNDHHSVIIQDHHQQQQPSSSRNNHPYSEIHVPCTPSSSQTQPSASASASASSPNTNWVNGLHYSILLNNNTNDLQTQIDDHQLSTLSRDPDNSTLLHMAASVGQSDFIKALLERSPDLLKKHNSKGDLPLHVAARACLFEAVKTLVNWDNNNSLRTLDSVNNSGDTALHIALQNHQEEMACFLFQHCSHTFYLLNEQGFCPLYLAIKAEFWNLAIDMLSDQLVTLESKEYLGKENAKSVIHAAITAKNQDIVKLMLEAYNPELTYKTDEKNISPLSYAAYTGFHQGVKHILDSNNLRNMAFIIDKNGHFPIHWACSGGYMNVVKEFFGDSLPKNTKLLLNNRGQNILHVAAGSGKAKVVECILQQQELETLINMKDLDGNTPLHLASFGKLPRVVYALTWDHRVKLALQNNAGDTALDIAEKCFVDIPSFQERLTWLCLKYAGAPRTAQLHYSDVLNFMCPNTSSSVSIDQHKFVNNNNTSPTTFMTMDQKTNPYEVVNTSPTTFMVLDQQTNSSQKNNYKERINTLLLVSILVTTVTYASGFTVPGSYNNNPPNEGMATLAHRGVFQLFVFSNTVAMYTSILSAVTLIWAHLDDLGLVLFALQFALPLLGIALAMMCVAFMAGLYVVIYKVVSWLSIVVLVVGGLFLSALLLFYIPLHSPFSGNRSRILSFVFHVLFAIMLFAYEEGSRSGTQHNC